MTQGLARVEELFEARTPKALAEIADISGKVEIEHTDEGTLVRIVAEQLEQEEYYFNEKFELAVKVGSEIKAKQILARNKEEKQRITAKFPGEVASIKDGVLVIKDVVPRVFEYMFDLGRTILVKDGDSVGVGQKLTEGSQSLQKLMDVAGVLESQTYIVNDIKSIYSSQGQTVNSKHIELIVRQMFSRVRVLDK